MNPLYLSLKNSSGTTRKISAIAAITIFVFGMVLTAGCTGPASSMTINAGTSITDSPSHLPVREQSASVSTPRESMARGNAPGETSQAGGLKA
jgi:hypothetical protein